MEDKETPRSGDAPMDRGDDDGDLDDLELDVAAPTPQPRPSAEIMSAVFGDARQTKDMDGFTLNPYTAKALGAIEVSRAPAPPRRAGSGGADGDSSSPSPTTASSPPRLAPLAELAASLVNDDDPVGLLRQQREGQVAAIERRRNASRRRCDLVDELYQRSIDRRLRAMRRIAADPPADRLVGRGMAQYIPASLLPQPGRPRRAPADAAVGAAAPPPSAPPLGLRPAPSTAANAMVFITETDSLDDARQGGSGGGRDGVTGAPSSAVSEGQEEQQQKQQWRGGGRGAAVEDPECATMREHWRELGYNVVFVASDGSRGSVRDTLRGEAAQPGRKGPTLAIDASKAYLVQRRLAEEEHRGSTLGGTGGSTQRRAGGAGGAGGTASRWSSSVRNT